MRTSTAIASSGHVYHETLFIYKVPDKGVHAKYQRMYNIRGCTPGGVYVYTLYLHACQVRVTVGVFRALINPFTATMLLENER